MPLQNAYYTLYYSLWVCRLLFGRTTLGTPVGQCPGASDPPRYSASRMSRMPDSVRRSWPNSSVVFSVASLLSCCSYLCGADGTESGVTVSSCVSGSCSLGSLRSMLPPVVSPGARGFLVTISAGMSICGCYVLMSASTNSRVGAAWFPCGVGSGSLVTVVTGSSVYGLMGGCACIWLFSLSVDSRMVVGWHSVGSAVSCSALAPTCCCMPVISIRRSNSSS